MTNWLTQHYLLLFSGIGISIKQDAGTDTICLEGSLALGSIYEQRKEYPLPDAEEWISMDELQVFLQAESHVMNAEVSFIAFSGFLYSKEGLEIPTKLVGRKARSSEVLSELLHPRIEIVSFPFILGCSGQPLLQGIVGIALCEGIVVTTLSLSTHYIEYNIYYYYYKYFYFLGVGMRARYEHANFFESTIGEKIRGYVLEGGYIFPIVSIAQPRNGQGFLLYPLDLNDPISNLVGDSLSGFDRILSFYFIDWHFLKSLELDPISNQLRLVYSIQQSEVEEKKEEKELGSLLNRAS
ncbi:hypothetical protein ACJX0J_002827 (mitochondrion) [Zea mays]